MGGGCQHAACTTPPEFCPEDSVCFEGCRGF